MHFRVLWIEPQRLLIFQQRRLQFALLGQRTGQVRETPSFGFSLMTSRYWGSPFLTGPVPDRRRRDRSGRSIAGSSLTAFIPLIAIST
jgi:hypothetical protein